MNDRPSPNTAAGSVADAAPARPSPFFRGFRARTALLLIGSAAVVGGALLFQYVGGLQPCELCLVERWPYYLAIPLALLALAAVRKRTLAAVAVGLIVLLFLGGTGLAFYHVGVEQHWFAGPTACTGSPGAAHTVEELKAQLLQQQVVRCDVPQWTLFGISLAGFNLLASVALAVIGIAALRARHKARA